jgi:hypothetical protein
MVELEAMLREAMASEFSSIVFARYSELLREVRNRIEEIKVRVA